MKDKQNDKQIEQILKNMATPPVDKQAKKRAINLAVAEFKEQKKEEKQKSFQGFSHWLRPIREITTPIRSLLMKAFNFKKSFNNKIVYSALGSICVATLCFGVLYSMMPHQVNNNARKDDIIVLAEERERQELAKKNKPSAPIISSSDQRLADTSLGALEEKANRGNKIQKTQNVIVSTPKETSAKFAVDKLQAKIDYDSKPQTIGTTTPPSSTEENSSASSNVPASRAQFEEIIVTANKRPLFRWPFKRKQKQERQKSVLADSSSISHDVSGYALLEQENDQFEHTLQNSIKQVSKEPVSTFSVDVDTSSYSFVRRQLNSGRLPQKDAVRVEEMINYFDYGYDLPESREQPFKPTVMVTPTPWNKNTKLLHIGIKGYEIDANEKPASNLVFLLDVSGSMNSPDKLPLVKQSMGMLLETLNPDDTISIVVYAGAAGTVLEPTKVKEKQTILSALNRLQAGGSTAGAQGIKLAYQQAEANFDKNAINRVILATDGDFNVGITDNNKLQNFIEHKRDKGIFLSILGFGQGNYKDHRMQTLAQNGNGVAAYIDTLSEAQKVLVDEASSMLFPIAKDVKIQVEFNPAKVSEYRLIGYETRHLEREDFNNDKVDAGDIGAGHTVTAIYEVTPTGSETQSVDKHRYQQNGKAIESDFNDEYAFLKIRYKLPNENKSTLITQAINHSDLIRQKANIDIQFASAVTAFAQILKGGKYTGDYNYDDVIKLAQNNKGADEFGYRTEFVQLVRKAKIADAM